MLFLVFILLVLLLVMWCLFFKLLFGFFCWVGSLWCFLRICCGNFFGRGCFNLFWIFVFLRLFWWVVFFVMVVFWVVILMFSFCCIIVFFLCVSGMLLWVVNFRCFFCMVNSLLLFLWDIKCFRNLEWLEKFFL